MAVTAIWAVHNSVKDVLDYATNPEKTENPNADDLKKLMDYAENPSKTEQRYLVSGVNCLPELAYERMTETKRRYGKPGGIVAYHGYMSFKPGEVTPKQCHEIGVELAKRLWGERFEVIVATHQDREHLHNHFVVNSVSFKDGAKFRCNKTYHRVLAEASDKLCLEHGLSVIEDPKQKSVPYVAYAAEKNGKPSHRTLLKLDIDDAIADCMTPNHLRYALERRGYTYLRGNGYKHPCVIAKGWKRPVRLDSLGEYYSSEAIAKRIFSKRKYGEPYRAKRAPLDDIWNVKQYEKFSTIEIVFLIVLELLGVDTMGNDIRNANYQQPLSPAMRQEQINISRYLDIVNLINRNDLSTMGKVEGYIARKESELADLLHARGKIDNRRRRVTIVAEKGECSRKRKVMTEEIRKIRHDINLAKGIFPIMENLKEKLKIEMETEERLLLEKGTKNKEKHERKEEKER